MLHKGNTHIKILPFLHTTNGLVIAGGGLVNFLVFGQEVCRGDISALAERSTLAASAGSRGRTFPPSIL